MTDQPNQPEQPDDPFAADRPAPGQDHPGPPAAPPSPQQQQQQQQYSQSQQWQQPQQNPYAAAPPPPQVTGPPPQGSLPYVEHYFGPVATFGPRALALIIDGLLTLIGLIPMIIGGIVLAVSVPKDVAGYDAAGNAVLTDGSTPGMVIGGLLIAVGFLAMVGIGLWNRVFRMGRTGQSVGKSVIGLKLINSTTGQPIGAGYSFLREIVYGIANQIIYLGYLWMLWDPNRKTLGDLAVQSSVIQVPKA